MAKNSADFSINLEEGTSGPALDAATALEKLRAQIDGDTKALREMEKAMRNLQRGTSVDIQQFRELKEKIEAKKQAVAAAQAQYLHLGGTFDNVRKPAKKGVEDFNALAVIAGRMPGPLGSMAQALVKIQSAAGAAKVVALKAAVVALTLAVVAGTAALLRYGIAQSEARRAEALHLEGLSKIRDWYGRSADSGAFLQATVDKVAASSALGRGELVQYTEQLYRMGLRAGNLEQALEGVAIVASTQGQEQAKLFLSMVGGARAAQGGIKRLTDDAKARLGGLAQAQMLSLSVQSRKLRENISGIFSGLKVEGFLKALKEITDLFSENTATGRALKAIFEALFQPMLDGMTALGPIAKRFFQGLVISALLLTIGFLKVRNALRDAFGGTSLGELDALNVALGAGVVVGGALAAVMAALALKIAIVTFPIWGTALALGALFYAAYKATDYLLNVDWGALGSSIVQGLVKGIKSGVQWVKEAMSALASAAVDTFRNKLGIASPAKVSMRDGLFTVQGTAIGMRRGVPEVERASKDLAEAARPRLDFDVGASVGAVPVPELPPAAVVAPRAERGGSGAAPSRAPITVTFGERSIVIETKGESATEIAEDLEGALTNLLQGVLTTLGGQPA